MKKERMDELIRGMGKEICLAGVRHIQKRGATYEEALELFREEDVKKVYDPGTKTVHKKIFPEYFEKVKCRVKRFEIRLDEDDIQPMDYVVLDEWDGKEYTGRYFPVQVQYVLRNVPQYGLKEGYCIFGW